jgi:hypothetical protein
MDLENELLIIKTSLEIAYLKIELFAIELQMFILNKLA